MVDEAWLKEHTAAKSHGRLQALKTKGAKVYTASGKPYKEVFRRVGLPGVYHTKVLVVDGLVAYNGGCNATNASLVNGEQVWKVTDAGVAADAVKAAWEEARGVKSL